MRSIHSVHSLWALSLTALLSACGGQESKVINGNQFIPNFTGKKDDAPSSTTPLCSDFAKTKDTDQDGLNDHDEFFGKVPADSTVALRSDFEVADTDGDGRSDAAEVTNKKIDGYTIQEPLKKNFALIPYQRDWLVFVFAKGGANSSQVVSGNGWNTYSGIGTPANALTQIKAQNGETLFIKALNDPTLVDKDKIPMDWRPFANGVREENTHCWRGTTNDSQGGCVTAAGDPASYNCSNNQTCVGPALNATIMPSNNPTKRNSLVGRFDVDGNPSTVEANVFAYPLGHLQLNFSADSQRILGLGNLEVSHTQPTNNAFILLRNQDGDGGDSLNDNSGFLTVIIRFNDTEKQARFGSSPTPAQTSEFYNRLRSLYGQTACKDS